MRRVQQYPLQDFVITPREEVVAMFARYGFYDSNFNSNGRGIKHQYEMKSIDGDPVVIDYATGLMWQQSGSLQPLPRLGSIISDPDKGTPTTPHIELSPDVAEYIGKLNGAKWGTTKFAGFGDWRLPTLEEVMSLMEPERKNGSLFIAPMFDYKQKSIWTVDSGSAQNPFSYWVVNFENGACQCCASSFSGFYVRAVRSLE